MHLVRSAMPVARATIDCALIGIWIGPRIHISPSRKSARAVVRLERGVRDERERIRVVDDDRRRGQRVVHPAGVVQRGRRRRQQLLKLLGERRVALGRVGAFVPLHDERVAALERRPRRIGDHRHARHQERGVVEAVDLDDVADAGDLPRFRGVDLHRPSVEDRALGDRRELHVRQPHVDAEQRLSGHDLVVVGAVDARANQSIARRIFERHIARNGERGRSRRQRSKSRFAPACRMPNGVRGGVAFGRRHAPFSRGRRRTSNARAVAPTRREPIPVRSNRIAAAHALAAIFRDRAAHRRCGPASSRRRAPRRRSSAATSSCLRPSPAAPTRSARDRRDRSGCSRSGKPSGPVCAGICICAPRSIGAHGHEQPACRCEADGNEVPTPFMIRRSAEA